MQQPSLQQVFHTFKSLGLAFSLQYNSDGNALKITDERHDTPILETKLSKNIENLAQCFVALLDKKSMEKPNELPILAVTKKGEINLFPADASASAVKKVFAKTSAAPFQGCAAALSKVDTDQKIETAETLSVFLDNLTVETFSLLKNQKGINVKPASTLKLSLPEGVNKSSQVLAAAFDHTASYLVVLLESGSVAKISLSSKPETTVLGKLNLSKLAEGTNLSDASVRLCISNDDQLLLTLLPPNSSQVYLYVFAQKPNYLSTSALITIPEDLKQSKNMTIVSTLCSYDEFLIAYPGGIQKQRLTLPTVSFANALKNKAVSQPFFVNTNTEAAHAPTASMTLTTLENIREEFVKTNFVTKSGQEDYFAALQKKKFKDEELLATVTATLENNVKRTSHNVNALAAIAIKQGLWKSTLALVQSKLLSDVQLVSSLIQVCTSLPAETSNENKKVAIEVLDSLLRNSELLHERHIVQLIHFFLVTADDDQVKNVVETIHKRDYAADSFFSHFSPTEYFLGLLLRYKSISNDIVIARHATELTLDEVCAVLKFLSKCSKLFKYAKFVNKQKQKQEESKALFTDYPSAHLPSLENILLWIRVFLGSHLTQFVMHAQTSSALKYLAEIRIEVAKFVKYYRSMACLPSQLQLIISKNNDKPLPNSTASGRFNYCIETHYI